MQKDIISIHRTRKNISRNKSVIGLITVLSFIGTTYQPALAFDATAPIEASDGNISCPTCVKSGSAIAANAVPYGTDGTQAISSLAPNSGADKKYLFTASSGTPAYGTIAIGDLSSMNSSDLAGKISDETGSGGGVVFATSPTITSPVISSSIDLPADSVNAITEVASSIKTGSGTKLATFTGSVPASNKCIRMTSGGDLEVTSGDCATGSGVNALIAPKSQTKVSNGSTTVYMDAVGALSTSASDIGSQTIVPAGTWGNLRCSASSNGTSASVTVQKGTCGNALSDTSMPTVSLTTANAVTSDTSTTFTTTADQCINFKIAKTNFAAVAWVTCVLERTANS